MGYKNALSAVANTLIDANASGYHLILNGHDVRPAFSSLIDATIMLQAAKRGKGVSLAIIRTLKNK